MAKVIVLDLNDSSLSLEFDELFRQHSRMVYRTAYGVTGNREDAQDILQTLFLRLVRRQLPPDFHQNPKAYLYRAAVNLSLDTLKARRRRGFIADVESSQIPARVAEAIPEDHTRLYEAVAALEPANREVLILRYVHEYTDAEIAKMLGQSRTAVAVRLFRSRARLKKILRDSKKEES